MAVVFRLVPKVSFDIDNDARISPLEILSQSNDVVRKEVELLLWLLAP